MARSNCLLFALRVWARRGGYLAIRRARPPLSWFVHWVWFDERGRMLHFAPVEREQSWFRALVSALWYEGRVRRRDDDQQRGH